MQFVGFVPRHRPNWFLYVNESNYRQCSLEDSTSTVKRGIANLLCIKIELETDPIPSIEVQTTVKN